jgi:hypothetical protein
MGHHVTYRFRFDEFTINRGFAPHGVVEREKMLQPDLTWYRRRPTIESCGCEIYPEVRVSFSLVSAREPSMRVSGLISHDIKCCSGMHWCDGMHLWI